MPTGNVVRVSKASKSSPEDPHGSPEVPQHDSNILGDLGGNEVPLVICLGPKNKTKPKQQNKTKNKGQLFNVWFPKDP